MRGHRGGSNPASLSPGVSPAAGSVWAEQPLDKPAWAEVSEPLPQGDVDKLERALAHAKFEGCALALPDHKLPREDRDAICDQALAHL